MIKKAYCSCDALVLLRAQDYTIVLIFRTSALRENSPPKRGIRSKLVCEVKGTYSGF